MPEITPGQTSTENTAAKVGKFLTTKVQVESAKLNSAPSAPSNKPLYKSSFIKTTVDDDVKTFNFSEPGTLEKKKSLIKFDDSALKYDAKKLSYIQDKHLANKTEDAVDSEIVKLRLEIDPI